MGHRCNLSQIEQEKIGVFNKHGKSNRKIAKLLNRSQSIVNNFFKLRGVYGNKKSSG